MSIQRLTANEVFDFIVGDFETAWSGLVARKGRHLGGGNFMFALMCMILLEFACRVCAQDSSGNKLKALTKAIAKTDRRYFTPIPGTCNAATEFGLPGKNPQSHLLGMMFDLIRNGKAHQYQSAIARLPDGEVDMDITGAASDRGLNKPGRRRAKKHLRYKKLPSGDLSLYVRTDQLFLDFKNAIYKSNILDGVGVIDHILRPKTRIRGGFAPGSGPHYRFTVAELEAKLKQGGHTRGKW